MKCPSCRSTGTTVKDSRPSRNGVRRRRKCLACGHRFTTTEQFDGLGRRAKNKGTARLIRRERVPRGVHPAVAFFFREKIRQNVSYGEIGRAALMSSRGMMCWGKSHPSVDNLEAALNALGYELHVRKRKK